MPAPSPIRCAIYTRKSSEEGLEQDFNSLDAQREACEAFILSQRAEGWHTLGDRYDDGGYSGGNMDRPGLTRLIDDVAHGKVDVIVVYKVDRLTRSLADFAKIIEKLDASKASFVSVTQQFNTTSSMGRLTLNVLLSFAQFEREVTGERIRDKIAASKSKGLWMGGCPPLGYKPDGRTLVIEPAEAALVKKIFALYAELGCVSKLKQRLDELGLRTKSWTSRAGNQFGGHPFSRGALYEMLRNRTYIGQIRHKDTWHPGQHRAIVPAELWERVQSILTANTNGKFVRRGHTQSLLAGLLRDSNGTLFTPSHSVKNGRRYCYYTSQAAIKNPGRRVPTPTRYPALDIERHVVAQLQRFMESKTELLDNLIAKDDGPAEVAKILEAARDYADSWPSATSHDQHALVRKVVVRVVLCEHSIETFLSRFAMRSVLLSTEDSGSATACDGKDLIHLVSEASLKRCGTQLRLTIPSASSPDTHRPTASLVKALARARRWYERIINGNANCVATIARDEGLSERFVGKVLRCAFLTPEVVEAILDGRQPPDLSFERLCVAAAKNWDEQRRMLRLILADH